jgi:hypothetical protein
MSLLIVIFAMMVFAVLGWTLNVMQATESQFGVRMLDSERALYLAESGMQEALMRIRIGDALFDQDTDQLSRTLGQGRYTVTRSTNTNLVTVTATGSYPAQNPHATRQVQAVIDTQIFMQRSGMIKNLLDWSAILPGSQMDGAIAVVDRPSSNADGYEGNGILPHNEPFDIAVPGSGDRISVEDDRGFPNIDMDYFKNVAQSTWLVGGIWDWTQKTAQITAITAVNASTINITVVPAIFTSPGPGPCKIFHCERGWVEQVAVRNQRDDAFPAATKWAYRNWGVITSCPATNQVQLTFDPSVNITHAANQWQINDTIVIVKRFFDFKKCTGVGAPVNPPLPCTLHETHNLENLWYVAGDVLLDVRDYDLSFTGTSVIAEGDIVIRGDNKLYMRAFKSTNPWLETYPNLATQMGDIYSPDRPKDTGGGGEPSRAQMRNYDGLVYSQNGDVLLNYADGVSVLGNNVFLSGYVKIKYSERYIESNGLLSTVTLVQWKEQ